MTSARDIFQRIQTGDMSAFEELVHQYQSRAYGLAVRLLCNESEAEDAVQETFVRIWQHIGRYDSSLQFSTWLYRIVTNLCLDKLRSRKRRSWTSFTKGDEDSEVMDVPSKVNLEERISAEDLITIVRSLSGALPDTQRLVFVLRDLQDLSIEEVCGVTGLSEGSVKTNLHYARRKIRERLVKEYDVKGTS
jgi:RNA polymerase sigma-70 factor (ECF subfamily)